MQDRVLRNKLSLIFNFFYYNMQTVYNHWIVRIFDNESKDELWVLDIYICTKIMNKSHIVAFKFLLVIVAVNHDDHEK